MSGKRKKDDSEAVHIMKFFKSIERNTLSSKVNKIRVEGSAFNSNFINFLVVIVRFSIHCTVFPDTVFTPVVS